jgi:hypothetical protein
VPGGGECPLIFFAATAARDNSQDDLQRGKLVAPQRREYGGVRDRLAGLGRYCAERRIARPFPVLADLYSSCSSMLTRGLLSVSGLVSRCRTF